MEQIAMGAPNIQQQLYLKKALNENTDGMFDHPEVQNEETITEGLMGKIKSIVRKVKQRKGGVKNYLKNKIADNRSIGQYHLMNKNPAAADKSYNKVAGYEKFSNKISEESVGEGYHMDRAHKILRSNERSKITPAEKARLKKAKAELDKIKPKYAPGQDPVVNSRKNS